METRTREKYNYLKIANGQLVETVSADTPGAKARAKKTGGTTHELYYDEIVGVLVGIKKRENKEYGDQLDLTILSGGEKVVISTMMDNKYAHDFFCRLPNMKPGEKIIFSPWSMKGDGDNNKVGLNIKKFEDDSKVENFFITYDANGKATYLNGYPPFQGEYSEANKKLYQAYKLTRQAWMEALMFDKYVPAFLGGIEKVAETKPEIAEATVVVPEPEEDLPF